MDNDAKAVAAQLQARLRMDARLGRGWVSLPPLPPAPSPARFAPAPDTEAAPAPAARPFTPPAPAKNAVPVAPASFAPLPPAPGEAAPYAPAARAAAASAAFAPPPREHVSQSLPLLSGAPERLTAAQAAFNDLMGCQKCVLCQTRRQVVFGEGSLDAALMFISEAPGRDEDFLGRPFVSTSGALLTDIIETGLRLRREDVFITNVLKCRPPGNRDPLPEEIAACLPCLEKQVAIVRPRVVVAVGRVAANILTGQNAAPGELRGKWFAWQGVSLTAIYHPSFLLRMRRSEGRGNRYDRETWADVQMIMRKLGQ